MADLETRLERALLDVGPSTAVPSERRSEDFYPTPREVTEALLPHLPAYHSVLDLGCGEGAILDVLGDARGGSHFTYGVELVPELANKADARGHDVYVADVMTLSEADRSTNPTELMAHALCKRLPRAAGRASTRSWGELFSGVDLHAMNPPFKHALAFVELALRYRREGATVAALLRGSFFESLERIAFHRRYPAHVLVIPNRIDFTRGAVRVCPTCDGHGTNGVGSLEVMGPCKRCKGKRCVKGGQDTAATFWWLFRPGQKVGTYEVLDPVEVPKLDGAK